MRSTPPDVIIVGAGAAGLFAARSAAQQGASVLLLEKTSRIGTKILISGGGKCNIAHAGRLEDVINAFPKQEAIFIRPSCYRMKNDQIMDLFESNGLALHTRPDGRVFPAEGTARDVLNILISSIEAHDIRVCLDTPVTRVLVEDGSACGVQVQPGQKSLPAESGRKLGSGYGAKALLQEALRNANYGGQPWTGANPILARSLVVCCGGASYPNSGTTGDGWKWVREMGHTVVKPRGALAPIYLEAPFIELAGVALQHVGLTARSGGKKSAGKVGDLLFTHQGISGPVVLELSREVAVLSEIGIVELELDLFPGSSSEQLKNRIESEGFQNSSLSRFLATPQSVIELFSAQAQIDPRKSFSSMSKKDRNRMIESIKSWPIGVVKVVPIERGEVTAGGVALTEVDPKTMGSKLVKGLYLAGEILDIAGPVGGYNLQAAFATGHVAGESAAKLALSHS